MDYLGGSAVQANRGYLGFDLILTDYWSGNLSNVESLFTVVANHTTILATPRSIRRACH